VGRPRLDPDNPPDEILLQWYGGVTIGGGGHVAPDWEHRAFWGTDIIPWGTRELPPESRADHCPSAANGFGWRFSLTQSVSATPGSAV
jgi:hypothetical protein